MVITAKFKGADSLGYENGKEYELKIREANSISVRRTDGSGICLYNSLSSFLKNWDEIRHKQENEK